MFELALVIRTTEGYLVAGDNPATACEIAILYIAGIGAAHAHCVCFRRVVHTSRHRITFGRFRTHTERGRSQTYRTYTHTKRG